MKKTEVKTTWQLLELYGLWWAYEGEVPPPEAFQTHGRSPHPPILGTGLVAAIPPILKHASASRPWGDSGLAVSGRNRTPRPGAGHPAVCSSKKRKVSGATTSRRSRVA